MDLLDYYLVAKAPFRIPDRTKEEIVRWWPRITTAVLVIVLLLFPFLKIWLNLAEFGASFGGVSETATFHYTEIALVVQWSLTAISLPGLFGRKVWGWKAIFCARIVGIVIGLLAISNITRAADGEGVAILALYIFLQLSKTYILFQIRSLYE